MKKRAHQRRVLARILAEDLRKISAGEETDGATVNATIEGGTGNWDITNVGWDGDKPEY